jgi:hypothetical protein
MSISPQLRVGGKLTSGDGGVGFSWRGKSAAWARKYAAKPQITNSAPGDQLPLAIRAPSTRRTEDFAQDRC